MVTGKNMKLEKNQDNLNKIASLIEYAFLKMKI